MRPLVNRSLAELIRARTRAIDAVAVQVSQLAAGWDDGGGPEVAARLSAFAPSLTDLPRQAHATYGEAWDMICAGKVGDFQETGEVVFALWDHANEALRQCISLAAILTGYGYEVAGLDPVREMLDKSLRKRDVAHRGWMWWTAEDEAAARAEIQRGGGTPIGDIIRELQARVH